jgi:four helix bundle protein
MGDKPRDLCERTFLFASDIVGLCRELSRVAGLSRQLAGQLLRAGTSVGANAEEAKAAYSRREFACKSSLVLRESREALYWLRLIAAHRLAQPAAVEPLLKEANELVAIYTASVRRAKEKLRPS